MKQQMEWDKAMTVSALERFKELGITTDPEFWGNYVRRMQHLKEMQAAHRAAKAAEPKKPINPWYQSEPADEFTRRLLMIGSA
jgi:hypothetical protein